MEKEKPNYYSITTAEVRYDKRLRANTKLLYGEITALCNSKGFCWATNKYFADLYGVKNRVIQVWIGQLVKCGYVKCQMVGIGERRIYLVVGGCTNVHGGGAQMCIHNNTYNKKGFLSTKIVFKRKNKTHKMQNDEQDIIECDEDGEPKRSPWGKKKGIVKKERKNEVALFLVNEFYRLAKKEIGIDPTPVGMKHYMIVLNALNKGKLEKKDILDLYDWWFSSGQPDDKLISLTACLSPYNIDKYKTTK